MLMYANEWRAGLRDVTWRYAKEAAQGPPWAELLASCRGLGRGGSPQNDVFSVILPFCRPSRGAEPAPRRRRSTAAAGGQAAEGVAT